MYSQQSKDIEDNIYKISFAICENNIKGVKEALEKFKSFSNYKYDYSFLVCANQAYFDFKNKLEDFIKKNTINENTRKKHLDLINFSIHKMKLLHIAALTDNKDIVELLLKDGHPVNAVISNSNKTPLHIAAADKLGTSISALLAKGAALNMQDEDGKTPLHIAIDNKRVGSVYLLLKGGANPNIKDNNGNTPLHIVTADENMDFNLTREEANVTLVKILLDKGALINIKNNQGNTPLHIVVTDKDWYHNAFSKKIEIVRLLLENQLSINDQNNEGDTPLHSATKVFIKSKEIAQLQNKMDIKDNLNFLLMFKLINSGIDRDIINKKGETYLDILPKKIKNEVKELIDLKEFFPTLFAYIKAGNIEEITKMFEEARKYNVHVDRNYCDKKGKTPVHLAVEQDKLAIVEKLINNCFPFNKNPQLAKTILYSQNKTPLYFAAKDGKSEIVKILLKYYDCNKYLDELKEAWKVSNINNNTTKYLIIPKIVDIEVDYCEDFAIQNDDVQGLKLIINYQKERCLNEKDYKEYLDNLLWDAIEEEKIEIVDYLISQNKDSINSIKIVENEELTPLNKAIKIGNEELCKLLMQNGATIAFGKPSIYAEIYYSNKHPFIKTIENFENGNYEYYNNEYDDAYLSGEDSGIEDDIY